MKRRTAALLMLLLLLAGCGEQPKTDSTAKQTEIAAADPETQLPLLVQIDGDDPAPGYVLVQTANIMGFLALPAEGEVLREIRQTRPDGSEWLNIIRMTPEGFNMAEADCPGHDCEQQGEVTLENMQDRVLWNMIICAPHELTLCLYTPEDAAALSARMAGN